MRIGSWKIFEHRIIDGTTTDLGPLLERWILIRHPKLFGIFLHKLCRSDHDRALHDHPWTFWSLVLKNGYQEEYWTHDEDGHPKTQYRWNRPGTLLYRPATWRHRVIISDKTKPAWTLVFLAPRSRRWGFWVPQYSGWVKWCWWAKYNPYKGICSENELYDTDGDE